MFSLPTTSAMGCWRGRALLGSCPHRAEREQIHKVLHDEKGHYRETAWYQGAMEDSCPAIQVGTEDDLVSVGPISLRTRSLFGISSTVKMIAKWGGALHYLFNCLHIPYCLLSFVMFIVYCKLLHSMQRVYELYLFSVRYSTTFKEALRGLFAASDAKDRDRIHTCKVACAHSLQYVKPEARDTSINTHLWQDIERNCTW